MNPSYLLRIEKEKKMIQEHKEKLKKDCRLENNSKFERLYEIAWSLGHSYGFAEVETYFYEMVDLIQ